MISRANIAEIRDRASLSSVAAGHVRLVRRGREHVGLCPFHKEKTPSFTVVDDKGFFHCFGCGAHGDVISFVMMINSIAFRDAVQQLSSGIVSIVLRPNRLLDAGREKVDDDQRRADERRRTQLALDILRQTDTAGEIVRTWWASRKLTCAIPESFRQHQALEHPDGGRWPAMVVPVVDVNGRVTGIHRTFLTDGGRMKALVGKGRERLMLGPCAGGAARLSPLAENMMVGEGIETVAAVRSANGRPALAALSTSGLRTLQLPKIVRSITILADRNAAGESAARHAAARWKAEGRRVWIARPIRGRDFNDVLLDSAA